MAAAAGAPLDADMLDVLPRLHDSSEARRKDACKSIQGRIRDLMHSRDDGRIRTLIGAIAKTLVGGPGLSERIGGLFGLSAASTALGSQIRPYLDVIVTAAVTALDDDRPGVRFAGCEALYNVAKVARSSMLRPDLFRAVFVAMLSVVGDATESDVRNGAWLLSTTLLDIAAAQGDALDLPLFLDLFRAHSQAANPHIRQALLTWLAQLDSVPGLDVGDCLPQFLGALLLMLQDPNGPVRSETHKVLLHFLRQLQSLTPDELAARVDLPAVVTILTDSSVAPHEFTRMVVFDWIAAVVRAAGARLRGQFPVLTGAVLRAVSDAHQTVMTTALLINQDLTRLVRFTEEGVPFEAVAGQVLTALGHVQPLTRRTALSWVAMLLDRSPANLMAMASDFLGQILDNAAGECDDDELSLHIQVLALMARKEAHEGAGADGEDCFGDRMLREVAELLRDSSNGLLERRGSYVLRHMCVVMDPARVYMVLARHLWAIEAGAEDDPLEDEDKDTGGDAPEAEPAEAEAAAGEGELTDEESAEFAFVVVEMMALVLLTAPELAPLRARLQPSLPAAVVPPMAGGSLAVADHTPETAGEHFGCLFKTWACNPVASLLLCLLAEQYEVACGIVQRLAAEPITVALLMQLDRTVQLLESPCFLQLRLHLCQPSHPGHSHLLRALYGILMALPQSTAFHTLRDRLTSVTSLHIGLSMAATGAKTHGAMGFGGRMAAPVDVPALLADYSTAQRRRAARAIAGDAEEAAAAEAGLRGWATRPEGGAAAEAAEAAAAGAGAGAASASVAAGGAALAPMRMAAAPPAAGGAGAQ